jgi:hypothetical protein
MNPATGKHEDNVVDAMLYMARELRNKTWRVTFGDGARRRQVSVPAGDLAKLGEALSQAKERFGLPALAPVALWTDGTALTQRLITPAGARPTDGVSTGVSRPQTGARPDGWLVSP